MQALVFSIEEFSTYDGPGVRTTVFLKGCPLRCEWCHNPEGQRFDNQILKAQSGCEGCGACMKAGEWQDGQSVLTDRSVAACPNRLLRWCGEEYTPQTLVQRLEKLIPLLNLSRGGVTFSGGEPLAQPEFLLQCLELLQGKTHRALQTSGYAEADVFEKVLGQLDFVLYDLKLADEEMHRRYTGVSNKRILDNFRILCRSGVPFVVRTPLIPGVTDTEENLTAIARLLAQQGVEKIELLPYNRFAGGKYAAVDMVYQPSFDESAPCRARTDIFEKHGIRAIVM